MYHAVTLRFLSLNNLWYIWLWALHNFIKLNVLRSYMVEEQIVEQEQMLDVKEKKAGRPKKEKQEEPVKEEKPKKEKKGLQMTTTLGSKDAPDFRYVLTNLLIKVNEALLRKDYSGYMEGVKLLATNLQILIGKDRDGCIGKINALAEKYTKLIEDKDNQRANSKSVAWHQFLDSKVYEMRLEHTRELHALLMSILPYSSSGIIDDDEDYGFDDEDFPREEWALQ